MIEEQARVVGLHGGFAEIVTQQRAACGSCSAKGGCGTSLLSAWFPQRYLTFQLENDIGARSGDTVIVGLDEEMLQRSSLLLYALPLAGLLLGAILGERLSIHFALPSELGAVVSGLLGLIGALAFVRYRTRTAIAGRRSGVRLLRVTHRSTTFAPDGNCLPRVQQPEGFRKYE